ncbi:hypothetical protein G9A89_000598, partial [Geosiphon pyriformis]
EQELKWFSNNNEDIMPKCTHDTDTEFNLRYPEKDAIKLEPHSCICIDLKVALKISATIKVQLAFRSSLAKKRINIKRRIINAEYVGSIIAMLQNNSEKTYIIEPNKKIAQTIFLSLVKIAQLVSVRNRKELEITYMLAIKKKVKDQAQLFETNTIFCESGEIGLTNLYIPAKSPKNIKISIYKNTGNIIKIPEETTIGYLTTKIKNQPPNLISDFLQLCEYHMQLKILLNNFTDIFASKNKFGRINIIQHQIKTKDIMPIKQKAY